MSIIPEMMKRDLQATIKLREKYPGVLLKANDSSYDIHLFTFCASIYYRKAWFYLKTDNIPLFVDNANYVISQVPDTAECRALIVVADIEVRKLELM